MTGALLSALPLLALVALGAACFRWRAGLGDPYALRQAVLDAATLGGLHVALSTEVLGAFGWLSRGPIAASWALLLAAALTARSRQPAAARPAPVTGVPAILWAGAGGIVAITLLIALAAPPNTWDSLTYHMPRVAQWLQNRSVDPFPTWCSRQVFMAPLAEYAIAQLGSLWGGDRLANLVQWGGQAGAIAGVSLVAARLGGGVLGQAIAALFAATLPMGILQASSTQTDAAVGFWLVALVCHGLLAAEGKVGADALLAGGALGLAVLTKQSAYFFAPPLLVWLVARALRRRGATALPRFASAAALALLLNLPTMTRTTSIFGSAVGPAGSLTLARGHATKPVPYLASYAARLFRNACLHLSTPIKPLNTAMARVMRELDVFARGWKERTPSWFTMTWSRHEDLAGNTLHFVLLACLLPGVRHRRGLLPLVLALAAGSLLFALKMAWRPNNIRLHLPLFVLAAPAAGLLLERLKPTRIAPVTAGVLFAGALPWLLLAQPRALLSRSGKSVLTLSRRDQYLANDRAGRRGKPFDDARQALVLGCRSVGLVMSNNDETWEYLFWVGTGAPRPGFRIRHVGVTNPTRTAAPEPAPGELDCLCDLRAGGGCSRVEPEVPSVLSRPPGR